MSMAGNLRKVGDLRKVSDLRKVGGLRRVARLARRHPASTSATPPARRWVRQSSSA